MHTLTFKRKSVQKSTGDAQFTLDHPMVKSVPVTTRRGTMNIPCIVFPDGTRMNAPTFYVPAGHAAHGAESVTIPVGDASFTIPTPTTPTVPTVASPAGAGIDPAHVAMFQAFMQAMAQAK